MRTGTCGTEASHQSPDVKSSMNMGAGETISSGETATEVASKPATTAIKPTRTVMRRMARSNTTNRATQVTLPNLSCVCPPHELLWPLYTPQDLLFSPEPFLRCQGVQHVAVWRSRERIPHAVETTAQVRNYASGLEIRRWALHRRGFLYARQTMS